MTGNTSTTPEGQEAAMTNPNSPVGLPAAAAVAANLTDTGEEPNTGPTVGASDADADAARSGADADLDDANRDSDGVPVGSADQDADARRSGADDDVA
jgi:hypothetical protein